MKGNLRGIIVPMTTPFTDEAVDLAGVANNVVRYGTTRLSGIFACGSNGENKSLTEREKLEVLEVVLEHRANHQAVIAGTGHESTRQTIALSRQAERLGVDYVAVLTPCYYRRLLTDDAMVSHYTAVADALTIPVLIYNAPNFTGVSLSPRVVASLAMHRNIVGIKDSAPGDSSSYVEVVGPSFGVFSGSMRQLFPALLHGAAGGVVSLANCLPEVCCDLYQRMQAGDLDGARMAHFRLSRLNRSLSGEYGVAGVKYAMELTGYVGGNPRLPLLPLADNEKRSIRSAMRDAGVEVGG